MSLTSNVTEKANLLWNIAEKLTGSYKPHEYGLVILPLTVIRRFDCILESTHEKVLEKHERALCIKPSIILRKLRAESRKQSTM